MVTGEKTYLKLSAAVFALVFVAGCGHVFYVQPNLIPVAADANHRPEQVTAVSGPAYWTDNDSTFYIGTKNGVYVTTNGGSSWYQSGLSSFDITCLAADPTNPKTVFAGTRLAGLYKSSDTGENFYPVRSSMGLDCKNINDLTIAGFTPANLMYAATDNGLYRSVDAGEHWQGAAFMGQRVDKVCLNPTDPALVYVTLVRDASVNVYAARDTLHAGQLAFSSLTGGLFPGHYVTAFSVICLDAFSSESSIAATVPCRLFSFDNLDKTVYPANARTVIYAGTEDGRVLKYNEANGVWNEALFSSTAKSKAVSSIATTCNNPLLVAVGTVGAGVFISIDGAKSGFDMRPDMAKLNANILCIVAHKVNGEIKLFAGTAEGVLLLEF